MKKIHKLDITMFTGHADYPMQGLDWDALVYLIKCTPKNNGFRLDAVNVLWEDED